MGLAGLIGLLQTAPYVKYGLQGKNLKQQKQTTDEMQNLARAQYDLDNPLYQKLYQQNSQAGKDNLAATIAEISRQNRKAVSMGRAPLLSQERGGESVFRNLVQGQQDIQNNAMGQTMGQLKGASSALQGVYNNQGNNADNSFMNNIYRAGAYETAGEGLSKLFGIRKTPETMRWNQGGTTQWG